MPHWESSSALPYALEVVAIEKGAFRCDYGQPT